MNEKEFEEKYNKTIKNFSKKYLNKNEDILLDDIEKEIRENHNDIDLQYANIIGSVIKFSMDFSTQLLKYVLKEMLVDKK
ncbi:hypothetical protein [Lactobacillus huangpiensis]|uniref:hypothetical protein n=1 Tax=Lactobacillus huangpiensis TaxID=2799571 RepID=UPI001CC36064|nr:hypothetical protein [Lactobacillus huangpiensis]